MFSFPALPFILILSVKANLALKYMTSKIVSSDICVHVYIDFCVYNIIYIQYLIVIYIDSCDVSKSDL